MQLSGEIGHADEVAGSVVCADAELLHGGCRVVGWRGELHEHAVQLCAGFGADGAVLGEEAEDAGGLLDAHAEAVGLRAAVVERFSEVADVADCLASASGERVGDLRSLAAGQVEHRQCVSHVFRGVAHGHAVRGGEVEGPCQAAGEYVGDAHAGLAEVVDRVG